jgi:hypothetical protein
MKPLALMMKPPALTAQEPVFSGTATGVEKKGTEVK